MTEDYESARAENTLVVIPAWNEEGSISGVIERLKALGLARIRVVDNGSSDKTASHSRDAGAEVVTEPGRGYGSACLRGYRETPDGIQWILFCDADGCDDLERIPMMFDLSAENDFVISNRRASREARAHMTPAQNYGNALAVWLIKLGWGFRYCDLGPMRLIRLDALRRLEMRDRNYGWTVEMQIRAVEEELRIAEIPTDYFARKAGRSKISGTISGTILAGAKILWTVFRFLISRKGRRVPA